MPSGNKQVKRKTRVTKISGRKAGGRPKETELLVRGGTMDTADASLVRSPSGGQSRRAKLPVAPQGETERGVTPVFVPVVGKAGKPLMPCHPARARELVRKGLAVRRFRAGIFYIQLTRRKEGEVQQVVVGIDPGSKREAYAALSSKHTFLNILSDAITWVKEAVKNRRMMRRARRNRKTPCRQNRTNRSCGGLAPSTRARWQAKFRIVNILRKLFPVTDFVVEDIYTTTFHGRKWNMSFSPLEVGKQWFYAELRKLGGLELKRGWETKELRDAIGLKKTCGKMDEKFSAHNVDSWVLANSASGGHALPDNIAIFCLIPLRFHRRQLHYFQPDDGGVRRPYGGTISQGLKRGLLVKHKKRKLCYLGGCSEKKGLSLHGLEDGKRICQNARIENLTALSPNTWRWFQTQNSPTKGVVASAARNS